MAQQFSIFWLTPLNCGWQNTNLVNFLAPAEQICIRTLLIKLCTEEAMKRYNALCRNIVNIFLYPKFDLIFFSKKIECPTLQQNLWKSGKHWRKNDFIYNLYYIWLCSRNILLLWCFCSNQKQFVKKIYQSLLQKMLCIININFGNL